MANLKILDTGYISDQDVTAQTQLSDVNRAGYTSSAVAAISLKQGVVSRGSDANIESKPVIGTKTNSATTVVSKTNTIYTVNFILRKEIITADWDKNNVRQIERLEETEGLKLLYPSNITDITGKKSLVEALGVVNINGNFADATPTDDEGTVSATTPYLVGHVRNLSMSDSPDGDYWKISFNFIVSGVP